MHLNIDFSWTLFLDRDGVLNKEKNNDYIYNWNEFVFYNGVIEAMQIFNTLFHKIVIVTNQRGVGKGWMTQENLDDIHFNLKKEVELNEGRIDAIFSCTDMNNDSINRKPNPGMAFQAQASFPTIDFSKSIMVGNKLSDMKFGKNAGMTTIFVATTHPETPFPHEDIDYRFADLFDFAKALKNS
ncbi:MAG: HAD-IIIA family hydrolase [Chitinophagaceae bacterium]|nr:HAD-IIIA family hydrolase [Chitinophagaceae bacterium]